MSSGDHDRNLLNRFEIEGTVIQSYDLSVVINNFPFQQFPDNVHCLPDSNRWTLSLDPNGLKKPRPPAPMPSQVRFGASSARLAMAVAVMIGWRE